MGLVTVIFLGALVLLIAFSAIYVSKSMENKPAFITRAVDKITANINQIALVGVIYGLGVAAMSLLVSDGVDMFVRFAANIMLVVMAVPFVFEKLVTKFNEQINPAVLEEARGIVGWITEQEKYVGYAGVVFSLLLFARIF